MNESSKVRLAEDISRFVTDPDDPEWSIWEFYDTSRFNSTLGTMRVRSCGEKKAVARITPTHSQSNYGDNVHGGAIMGFIDCSLFAAAHFLRGPKSESGVTLECGVQFMASGQVGVPLDSTVELLRETKRLIFVRGLVEQPHGTVASFTAILRKRSRE